MNNQASQKGIVSPIVALLIVPILSLILVIGVEIGGILSMVRSLENRLDRIALLVGRHLPDAGAAMVAANSEMLAFREYTGKRCHSIIPSIREIEGGVSMSAECIYSSCEKICDM